MKSVRESSEKSDDVSSSKQTNVDFEIAFLYACRKRKLDVVRRLLFEKRVDVNKGEDSSVYEIEQEESQESVYGTGTSRYLAFWRN